MTEAEWVACNDPTPMLEFLRGKASGRKLRLFAVACCHRIEHFLDERCRSAVLVAERFADGQASLGELDNAERDANTTFCEFQGVTELWSNAVVATCVADDLLPNVTWCARDVIMLSATGKPRALLKASRRLESRLLCRLLREVVGNPFCPIIIAATCLAWNDGAVRKMAQALYDARAFDRLPLLADALEDAGCTDGDILAHCRSGGEHVRGCWVVDLLLGRS